MLPDSASRTPAHQTKPDVVLARFPSEYRLKRRLLIGALFSSSRSRGKETRGNDARSNDARGQEARSQEARSREARSREASSSLSETRTSAHGVVRVLFRLSDRESSGTSAPYQIAFSVPRRVRRAVDRNRLKRLLRVAFQQMKPQFDRLPVPADKSISFMVLFRGDGRSVEHQVGPDTMEAFRKVLRDVDSLLQLASDSVPAPVTKQS